MSKRDFGAMVGSTATSPILPMFDHFRVELDEHHERRERVSALQVVVGSKLIRVYRVMVANTSGLSFRIKASRDITAASKKIIFALQRVRTLHQPLPNHVTNGNKQYYGTMSTQFTAISRDLQSLNTHRYSRQISGGCQEFVEAASFEHYLTTASLLEYDAAAALMKKLDPGGPGVELSHDDYLLGIYDMTGELMKFAITAMATNGELPTITSSATADAIEEHNASGSTRNVLNDMQDLRSALEFLDVGNGPFARDVEKKSDVMKASVEKVEKALYGLTVRGAERPKGWMPDTSDNQRAVEAEG